MKSSFLYVDITNLEILKTKRVFPKGIFIHQSKFDSSPVSPFKGREIAHTCSYWSTFFYFLAAKLTSLLNVLTPETLFNITSIITNIFLLLVFHALFDQMYIHGNWLIKARSFRYLCPK